MKYKHKNKIILIVLMLFLGLSYGCGEKKDNRIQERKMEYDEEESSMEKWKKSLPKENKEISSAKSVRGLEIVKGGETVFAVSYEPREYKSSYDCWSISVPYKSWVSVDTEKLYEYFSCLEDLSLEKVADVPDNTGLEESRIALFASYYSKQNNQSQGQAEPDQAVLYEIGLQDENGDYFVKINKEEEVWKAKGDVIEKLLNLDPFNCILKIANVVDVETISTVDIELKGKKYTLDFTDEEDKEEAYKLYTSLISIFIEKENLKEEHTEESPLLRITYNRNFKTAPKIVETFYVYNKQYVSVSINGNEFFLVNKGSVNDLIEQIKEFFK